jgi:hypothetical protein
MKLIAIIGASLALVACSTPTVTHKHVRSAPPAAPAPGPWGHSNMDSRPVFTDQAHEPK